MQASLVHLHAHLSAHRPAAQLLYRELSPTVSPPVPASRRHYDTRVNSLSLAGRDHSQALSRVHADGLAVRDFESVPWGGISRLEWLDAEVRLADSDLFVSCSPG